MYNSNLTKFGLLFFGVLGSTTWGAVFNVDTEDRGYYYNYDFNDPTNKNYLTGQLNVGTVVGFHSFFSFGALSGLDGPITAVTLHLFNPDGGYVSTQASETMNISAFSGNVSTLEGGGTVSGEYSALASGTVLGSQSVSAADNNAFVDITLNSDAIAFLNSNLGNPFA